MPALLYGHNFEWGRRGGYNMSMNWNMLLWFGVILVAFLLLKRIGLISLQKARAHLNSGATLVDVWEEDQKFTVNANQTLVLWPNRRHGGLQVHDRRLAFYWLHFSISGSGGKGATVSMLPQLGTPARPDRLRELFHRFLSDFGAGDDWKSGPLNDPRADLLLMQILTEAATQQDSEKSAQEPALAQNIRAYIDAHFFEPIGPADVVKSLRYSGVYLRQTFRHATGLTLSQAIQNRRMMEARRLLLETTLTLKEIAFRCGFDDEGYFCRVFRKNEGVNPTVFRNTRLKLPINVI